MQTPIYDLELPDTFHRNKRTLLLFSTAALLVSLARVSGDLQLTTPYLDADIDKVTVWALLWGAAAYYALGFLVDVSSVLRRFSSFVEKHSPSGVDAAIDELSRKLSNLAVPEPQLEERLRDLGKSARHGANIINRDFADEAFHEAMRKGVEGASPSTFGSQDEGRMVVTGIIKGLKDLVEEERAKSAVVLHSIEQKLDDLRSEARSLDGQASAAMSLLQSTKLELGKLSPTIIRERRAQLRLWECAAPFVFFLVMTVMSAPEAVIAVRRIVDVPAVVQSWSADVGCAWRLDRPTCEAPPQRRAQPLS